MLRKHQKLFKDAVTDIISGSGVKIVDIVATPGAGKSSIPIQATELIRAGLADAILWVVPRSALQSQGERGFMDPFFRDMLGHNSLIRSSTNEIDPCRGTHGFVTTYQAIAADKFKTVLAEVKSKRYIIILDEFHHLEDGGVWHEAINDIILAGTFLVKMTGTLGRGDKKQIAYIDYKKKLPHFKSCGDSRLIVYSRVDALKEKAILPIEFHLSDGEFKYLDQKKREKSIDSFNDAKTPKQKSDALFTALNSDFAADLLRACVMHWNSVKKLNPGAKLLIVTADYEQAKNVRFMLQRSVGVNVEIATSHESVEAIKSINNFKSGKCNALSTIAMAYEGLDVPGITHICALTNIRTREWIEQMLARGVRIDKTAGHYESQRCYVFAPMDSRFKKVVDMIKKQQVAAIEYYSQVKAEIEPDPEEIEDNEELEKDPIKREEITPISGSPTWTDSFLMGDGYGDHPEENKNQKIEPVIETIKEQEVSMRKKIHSHINKFCFDNRYEPATINSEIKNKGFKKRSLMTLPELKKLQSYIIEHYPICDNRTLRDIPGLSLVRGTGKRVSPKVEPWTGRSEILKQSCYDPIRHLLKG